MKRLLILFMLISTPLYAQCVAEIKDVVQDELRGSIVVKTEYKLNGEVVQNGETRYDENSGTNAEIIQKAKNDIDEHCKNLIIRIEDNKIYIQEQVLTIQKELTTPIIQDIKDDLIGYITSKTEAIQVYKDQEIKVTYDEKNTVSAINITAEPISK